MLVRIQAVQQRLLKQLAEIEGWVDTVGIVLIDIGAQGFEFTEQLRNCGIGHVFLEHVPGQIEQLAHLAAGFQANGVGEQGVVGK